MILLNLLSSMLISLTLIAGGETSERKENPSTPTIDDPAWEMVDQDEILTIYERWIILPDGRKTRERKGEFYTNSHSSEIVPLVSSASGIKNWMRGVEESREIDLPQTWNKTVYILFDAPWPFKNRDLVTEIRTVGSCDEGCIDIFFSAKGDMLPENKNVIRMRSYEAHWSVTTEHNGLTKVSFSAYTDTEPVAPRWIQDPVTEKLFKDNLLNLRKLLTLNSYDHEL